MLSWDTSSATKICYYEIPRRQKLVRYPVRIAEEHWLAHLYLKLAEILGQYFITLQAAMRCLRRLKFQTWYLIKNSSLSSTPPLEPISSTSVLSIVLTPQKECQLRLINKKYFSLAIHYFQHWGCDRTVYHMSFQK